MRKAEDITGQRFERLLVLEKSEKEYKNGTQLWKCKCDCGNLTYVASSNLKRGATKSCGCFAREKRKTEHEGLRPREPIDLTNQRFGRLIALEYTKHDEKNPKWKCKCDCGNIVYVMPSSLKRNLTKSCGCFHKEVIRDSIMKDLTDQRFGRLVALEPEKEIHKRGVVWKCKCDCGNITYVKSSDLQHKTKSCGCLLMETFKNMQKDIAGQRFGKLVALTSTGETDKKGGIIWKCKCDCGNIVYKSVGRLSDKHGPKSCGCLLKKRNTDLWKTIEQNFVFGTNFPVISKNDLELQKNNTSGYTGVHYNSKIDKWVASCTFQGYAVHKKFKTKDQAIKARQKMKIERDKFLDWYNSLSEEEQFEEAKNYEDNKKYYKKLYRERINELFRNPDLIL